MATSILKKNFPGVDTLQEAANQATFIIGLDLHKKTTAICVIDPNNPDRPVFQRKRFKNNELLEKIKSFSGKKVIAAESAYGWFPLREALKMLEDTTLVLLDPRKTSSWIQSTGIKNDKIDAQVLCHVCLHGAIPRLAVHQPSREAREHFKLVNIRERFVSQRTSVSNQIKAIDRDYGANPYTGEIEEPTQLMKNMKELLTEHLNNLNGQIAEIDKQIADLSKNDKIIKLLKSIPGIGPVSAFAIRHKVETIERFKDPSRLSSYFGFGIREYDSGDHRVKGKITKTGNVLVRTLLVQGAQTVRNRCPGHIPLYFPKLGKSELMEDRKHANKVVIALARKNLTFVFHVWKNKTAFDLNYYRKQRSLNMPSKSCRTRSVICSQVRTAV